MTLNALSKGKSANIIAINAEKELKNRLNSFGLVKGATIHVEKYTLAKQTMEVRVHNTRVALRISEAKMVEIYE